VRARDILMEMHWLARHGPEDRRRRLVRGRGRRRRRGNRSSSWRRTAVTIACWRPGRGVRFGLEDPGRAAGLRGREADAEADSPALARPAASLRSDAVALAGAGRATAPRAARRKGTPPRPVPLLAARPRAALVARPVGHPRSRPLGGGLRGSRASRMKNEPALRL
jgi:hypothetical protein